MNELTLTELDMGFSIPKILHASAPSVDHQGRKTLHYTCLVFTVFSHGNRLWVLGSSVVNQSKVQKCSV